MARTADLGYGAAHQRLRRRLQAIVDSGAAVCWRCRRPVLPGSRWHVGHDDVDRSQYASDEPIEHAACNIGARKRLHARRVRARELVADLVMAVATIKGSQVPTTSSAPDYASTLGAEIAELCALCGLVLDEAQRHIMDRGLGRLEDGQWAAPEVAIVVSRQNLKSVCLAARELAGLFLIGEKLIVHSAHEFATSLESFRLLVALIEEGDLSKEIKSVSRSHGDEGIELHGGQRIRFRTRTRGGGGASRAIALLYDEAQMLAEDALAASLPRSPRDRTRRRGTPALPLIRW